MPFRYLINKVSGLIHYFIGDDLFQVRMINHIVLHLLRSVYWDQGPSCLHQTQPSNLHEAKIDCSLVHVPWSDLKGSMRRLCLQGTVTLDSRDQAALLDPTGKGTRVYRVIQFWCRKCISIDK